LVKVPVDCVCGKGPLSGSQITDFPCVFPHITENKELFGLSSCLSLSLPVSLSLSLSLSQQFWVLNSGLTLTRQAFCHLSHVLGFLIKTPIPYIRSPPSWLVTFQRSHFLASSHWGLGFQHMNLGSTNTFYL
jgi:hypothetical protein